MKTFSWLTIFCLYDLNGYFPKFTDGLTPWGLGSESEKHQRKQVQAITDPENLLCEMVPFKFRRPGCDTEIPEAEFGYITDLNRFIQLQLDENEK